MNKQEIIDYIELLEAKAYQSDDYFKQRNELYILNQKYKEVLDKIKEIMSEDDKADNIYMKLRDYLEEIE